MKYLLIIIILLLIITLFAENYKLFLEFQEQVKRESYRVANRDLHKQIKQSRDSREYEIGDTHIYWRYDLSVMPPGWIQVPATCRAVGEHSYVFVADSEWQINMDEADVQEVVNYLEYETMNGDDYGAVEMDTLHFGAIPDELDNDPKLIVFYSALGSFGGSTFDGYFSSYDQVTEAEAQQMNPPGHSNECEMIYMTCHPLDPTDPIRISVLAHELQHLIHWGGDINEDTWVNEGLAELAMVYFGMPDPISQFNSNPDNSLNTWNQEWADYVKTMLFFTYFAEQFDDGTIIKDIVSEPLNSIAGISNQLIEHGYTIPFEAIFNNWTIANFIDNPDVAGGIYNYESLNLPIFQTVQSHNSFPASFSSTVSAWAADYIKIYPPEAGLTMHFIVDNYQQNIAYIKKYLDGSGYAVDTQIIPGSWSGMSPPEWFEDYEYIVIVFPSHSNSVLEYEYEFTEMSSADINNINFNINLRNYPNPFNLTTTISFQLTEDVAEKARLDFYNIKGQKIKQYLIFNDQSSIMWDGTNQTGKQVSSGIYYYKLSIDNDIIETKKMLLMK